MLWSDAQIFARYAEGGGNAMMYTLTKRALQLIRAQAFSDPIALLEAIRPDVHAFGAYR